jgi:geranylgeranyl pyrophosphate synthase
MKNGNLTPIFKDIHIPLQLRRDLTQIETILRERAQSAYPLMNSMVSDLVQNGGKRIRPLMLMTVFRGMNGRRKREKEAYRAAASLELIHTATLIHDDLIDQSMVRRGAPTIFAKHGMPAAVLAGDFLFVEAYALTSGLPENLILKNVSDLRKMAEGQLLEESTPAGELTFSTYLDIIMSKTASMFRSACISGAMLAETPEEKLELLGDAGLILGVAFQFIDDILDVIGDETMTGKPVGTDFLAQKMTLPYFLYEEQFGKLPQERSLKTFQNIYQDLTSATVITKAKEMALEKTTRAKEGFSVLTNTNLRTFILDMCDRMVNRIL